MVWQMNEWTDGRTDEQKGEQKADKEEREVMKTRKVSFVGRKERQSLEKRSRRTYVSTYVPILHESSLPLLKYARQTDRQTDCIGIVCNII